MRGHERTRWLLRRAQWLVLPLLVLGLAEACVRLTADRVPTWYGAAERLAATRPVQVLFVGSSRVQAAILPVAFEQVLAERGRPGLAVLNLGRGYSTDPEHYLGLRNLLAAHSDTLRGVTVFAEAPGGAPFATRWETVQWAMAEQPWMLVDLLRASDLPRFWRWSGLDFETRLHLSVRVVLSRLALFNRRERVREQWLDNVLPTLARGRRPDFAPTRILGDDLQGWGNVPSIRTDPAALAAAREAARDLGEQMARHQAPVREWQGTLPEAFVRLVQGAGGHMVFFEPPQSEVFLRGFRTKVRQEDAALFARQARAWGACVVRPAFAYSEDDLPDFWHLRPERAADYTRAVAVAWLETCAAAR
jgi:hypothetical protein